MNTKAKAPLYFVIGSIASQAGALGVVLAMSSILDGPWQAVLMHGVAAMTLGFLFKLSLPWILVNGAVAPATLATTAAPWFGTLSFVAVVFMALLFAPALWTRVPYFPTSKSMYASIASEIPGERPVRFIDIGCGFGPLLIYLAQEKPEARIDGIELGFLPYLISKIRSLFHESITVSFGDFWKLNLGEYDVVYAFLSPAAMERLWQKVTTEMKPGSVFITNSFQVQAKATRRHEHPSGTLHVFEI